MLEKLDLKKKVSKEKYDETMEELGKRLGQAQRDARNAKMPIIILFEGWRGARRTALINKMMQQMDARGFNVYSTVRITEEDHKRPFFTFFWQHLPAQGGIVVYHRSWYYLKNVAESGFAHEDHHECEECKNISFDHINTFEKELTADNYLILKYFLHVSPEQQKKNIAKNTKTLGKAWRDINPAIDESNRYNEYLNMYEKMLEATDTGYAPWHIIAADDNRSAQLEVFSSIADSIEKKLKAQKPEIPAIPRPVAAYDVLSKIDPNKEMTKSEYKKKLEKYQKKLALLQIEMYKAQIPAVIGFEGWDAGGKGGAIRRLTAAMDPLGYSVHPVASPNAVERQFHYLWRFWIHLPQPGSIAIFDRTWYGRVMVERLEGFAKPHEWARAYDEIKDMEEQWAEHGIAIAKFWIHIDKDEQLRRFTERQNDPHKQWKITDEDWRNREKWDAYEEAVNEMLMRTDTSFAPWTVVEGNNKYYARVKVLKTVVDLFEKKLAEKK